MLDLLNNPFFVFIVFLGITSWGILVKLPESVPATIFLSFALMSVFFSIAGLDRVPFLKAVFLPSLMVTLIFIKIFRTDSIPWLNLFLIALSILTVMLSAWLNGVKFNIIQPYLGTLIIAVVVALCPNNDKTDRYTITAFAIWGGINLLGTLFQLAEQGWAYRGDAIHTGFRVIGLMGNSTMMGVYFVIAFSAVYTLACLAKSVLIRLIMYSFSIALAVGTLGTLSRASIFAEIVAFMLIQRKLKSLTFSGIIGLCFAGLLIVSMVSFLNMNSLVVDRFKLIQEDPSAQDRVPLIKRAWEKFEKNPLLGIGLSQGGLNDKNLVVNSHNTFIQKIMEGGILGFSLFCLLLWIAAREFWKRTKLAEDAKEKAFNTGLLAAFVGILVNGIFHDLSYLMPLWLLIGMGLTGNKRTRRETY